MFMAGKVIHISDELYEQIQDYCKKHNVPSGQWAREVLERAVSDGVFKPTPIKSENTSPVARKKLPPPPQPNKDDELWTRPPFWKNK